MVFFLNKGKELEFTQFEQREKRYKSAILFMECYLFPEKIHWMQYHGISQVRNANDIRDYLVAEFQQMAFFASKSVLASVKKFIEKPTEENFLKSLMEMRKDLWIGKYDLKVADLRLSNMKR